MRLKLRRTNTNSYRNGKSIWRRSISLHPRLDRFSGKKVLIFLSVLTGIVFFLPIIAYKLPNILGLTDETSIYFPENITVNPGVPFDVPVMLTAIDSTVGVDLVASFDPTKLELLDVIPQVSTSVFGTFAPLSQSGNFDSSIVISRANSNGNIIFSALAYDRATNSFQIPFRGQLNQTGPLALLRFRPLASSVTTISINGSSSRTNDSNVTSANTGADTLVNVAPIQVMVSNTPTPTPTPAPAQTSSPTPLQPTSTPTPAGIVPISPITTTRPTNTPSLRPTNTPTRPQTQTPTPKPSLTPTPTSMPQAGEIMLTFSISESANDVNQDGGKIFDTSAKTIWLGSGSSKNSFTGLRFTGVNIPRNSQIISAKLRFYVPQTSWITMQFQIAAERAGNSREFRNNARPAGRTLTSAKVQHSSNDQWQGGTWVNLDEMAPVVQEVINLSDWRSANALSIIIKNTSNQPWTRKFVSSWDDDPSRAPQLVVSFIPPAGGQAVPTEAPAPTSAPSPAIPGNIDGSSPTPTPTPTPRPTSTPTPRPTSTPTPTNTPTPTVSTSSWLLNPSFESGGLSNWITGYSIQTSTDAYRGNVSARISENSDYITQNLEGRLTPGKTYTFTVYVKVLTPGTSWGSPSFRLSIYEDLGTSDYGLADAINSTSAGWQKLTFSKSFTSSQINRGLYLGVKHSDLMASR